MCEDDKKCPFCGEKKPDVKRRRRNTQYVDDDSNYLTACRECQDIDDEYFAERWSEYYSGCL